LLDFANNSLKLPDIAVYSFYIRNYLSLIGCFLILFFDIFESAKRITSASEADFEILLPQTQIDGTVTFDQIGVVQNGTWVPYKNISSEDYEYEEFCSR
jgi:hypothetical protein